MKKRRTKRVRTIKAYAPVGSHGKLLSMRLLRFIWYRFCYRRAMIVAHRFGWHHMRESHPDGDTMLRCHWCGIRVVTYRAPRQSLGDAMKLEGVWPRLNASRDQYASLRFTLRDVARDLLTTNHQAPSQSKRCV